MPKHPTESVISDEVIPFAPEEIASHIDDRTPPPVPSAEAAALARLQQEFNSLKARFETATMGGVVAPAGFKLVPDVPNQETKSLAEQEAIKAEIEKGSQRRTQEAADRMFPEGRSKFKCLLPDGNGNPELVINADSPADAAHRYLKACGVISTEHRVIVQKA